MKKNKFMIFAFLLITIFSSTACYISNIVTQDEAIATEVEKALDKILQETAAAKAAETYTPYPTYTPEPTYTAQPYSVAPYFGQYIPSDSGSSRAFFRYCNNATFISETITDNTIFNPGDVFTKTWTLRNTGQCTWTTAYQLVFTSGNSLSGVVSSNLPYDVPPGGVVTLSVDLTAPYQYGLYKGIWSIKSDNGYTFAKFWVQIFVR